MSDAPKFGRRPEKVISKPPPNFTACVSSHTSSKNRGDRFLCCITPLNRHHRESHPPSFTKRRINHADFSLEYHFPQRGCRFLELFPKGGLSTCHVLNGCEAEFNGSSNKPTTSFASANWLHAMFTDECYWCS